MRIIIDLEDGRDTHLLTLAQALAQHPGNHQIIIALSAAPLETSLALRRRFESRLPKSDIRVWHAPGPEPVKDLLRAGFLADLVPDIVITARTARFPDLPVMGFGAIPVQVPPDRISAAVESAVHMLTSGSNRRVLPDQAAVKPTLAVVSPLPPERTGIADYTADLLPALARYYHVDVIVSQSAVTDPWILAHCQIYSPEWFMKNGARYDRILYHMGNSQFHHYMIPLMNAHSGVVCLHDFFLGHYLRYAEARDPDGRHWAGQLYLSHGYPAVKDRFLDSDTDRVTLTYPGNFSFFQSALGVVTHSGYARNLARSWYPEYPARLLAEVPLVRTPAKDPSSRPRPGPGVPDTGFVVCAFGMLGPFKLNHRLLSAWLNSGLADDPDCHLVFVGENDPGSYGRDLMNTIAASRAKDRIHVTGWASGPDFSAWLSTADVAVQLRTRSRGETSAAVLDCMNHGLPVIVNAHGANAELPAASVWRLEDLFDDADLTLALETLYRQPGTRQRLGHAARAVISCHHAPEICARQYARVLENVYHLQRYRPRFLVQRLAALDRPPRGPARLARLSLDIAANQPDPVPEKRLFIDVSATCRQDLKAGIDRVSRSIVLGLLLHPPSGWRAEPVFLDDADGLWHFRYARVYALSLLGCPDAWMADDPVEMRPGDLLLCPDLTGDILVKALNTGLYDRLRQTGVALVFTVFDLLPLLRPDMFPSGAKERFHEWLTGVCRVADQVVCISRSVANELHDRYATDPAFACLPLPDIGWFHLGADLDASAPTTGMPDTAAACIRKMQAGTCFLMVGTLEPRKGHMQTIAAFDRLWQAGQDVTLVIVGKQGWTHLPDDQRRTILQIVSTLTGHPEQNRRLFWLEGISDQYLEAVYKAADCLIAASEAEGFGLPLIEAAQHDLPVMARDIPVFREVAGDHAFYFDGTGPKVLADAVFQWLDLYRHSRHPRSDAMPWLTWRQSCEQMMHIMAPLLMPTGTGSGVSGYIKPEMDRYNHLERD